MKYRVPALLSLALSFLFLSCSEKQPLQTDFGSPQKLFAELQGDMRKWWTYHKVYAPLYKEFVPLDEKNQVIDKESYLRELTKGDFMSIKLYGQDSTEYYKLYRLEGQAQASIRTMISDDAALELDRLVQIGRAFPEFNFTDLEGNQYTSETLKGKTVFIKTWFVSCAPCIAEMPELNEMVADFSDRDDVVFLSLALDKPDRLERFLEKTQFDYAVVAEQADFINGSSIFGSQTKAYPTHVIINGEGIVEKVAASLEELTYSLEQSGI